MKKCLLVFASGLIVLLIGSCSLFVKPDYVGTWTATIGTAPAATTVTVEFTKTTFSVSVDTPVTTAVEYLVTGDLAEAETEATLDATITAISQNGTALTAAELTAFLTANSLTADQSITYTVTGETITVAGVLLLALTGQSTLTATLVP